MVSRAKSAGSTDATVLCLSIDAAEWLSYESGQPRHATAPVTGPSAEELAQAALEAVRAAGSKPGACLLALGSGLLEQRTLNLPELGRSQLGQVLARKSAALLETHIDDVLFAALPILGEGSPGSPEAARERKWFVVAMRHKFMLDLRLALRRRGFVVRRVVAARLARLCRADALRSKLDQAGIVIDVERDGVVVSLVAQGSLRHQNRMQGSLADSPTIALSLLQELKSFDAFWRRLSRGECVADVVVLGLEPDRAQLFATALQSALPEARVCSLPEPVAQPEDLARLSAEQAAGRYAGRIASLQACAAQGPYNLDLTLHIPAPHAYVATLVVCLLVVAGGLGSLVRGRLSGEVGELEAQTREFQGRASELERLREENERTLATLSRLADETERLVAAGQVGMPLEAALEHALAALDQRALLTTFSSEYEDGAGEVRLGGMTDPDPLISMRALSEVAAQIESSASFERVSLDQPTQRPDDVRGARAPLLFDLRAGWQVAR